MLPARERCADIYRIRPESLSFGVRQDACIRRQAADFLRLASIRFFCRIGNAYLAGFCEGRPICARKDPSMPDLSVRRPDCIFVYQLLKFRSPTIKLNVYILYDVSIG